MGRGLQGALLRGFGGRDHEATVTEVTRVAPHFVRITMSSPTLFEDVAVEPTAFLRFWFPDPEGSDSEFQRVYTICGPNPARADSQWTWCCTNRRDPRVTGRPGPNRA